MRRDHRLGGQRGRCGGVRLCAREDRLSRRDVAGNERGEGGGGEGLRRGRGPRGTRAGRGVCTSRGAAGGNRARVRPSVRRPGRHRGPLQPEPRDHRGRARNRRDRRGRRRRRPHLRDCGRSPGGSRRRRRAGRVDRAARRARGGPSRPGSAGFDRRRPQRARLQASIASPSAASAGSSRYWSPRTTFVQASGSSTSARSSQRSPGRPPGWGRSWPGRCRMSKARPSPLSSRVATWPAKPLLLS